jgi:hypothetical protein
LCYKALLAKFRGRANQLFSSLTVQAEATQSNKRPPNKEIVCSAKNNRLFDTTSPTGQPHYRARYASFH